MGNREQSWGSAFRQSMAILLVILGLVVFFPGGPPPHSNRLVGIGLWLVLTFIPIVIAWLLVRREVGPLRTLLSRLFGDD